MLSFFLRELVYYTSLSVSLYNNNIYIYTIIHTAHIPTIRERLYNNFVVFIFSFIPYIESYINISLKIILKENIIYS